MRQLLDRKSCPPLSFEGARFADVLDSNLTGANHLIFLGPYYTQGEHGQSQWESAITQSQGRCVRYGQGKEVHSYFFLNRYTVDVDVFEARVGKRIPERALWDGECEMADLEEGKMLPTVCGSAINEQVFPARRV